MEGRLRWAWAERRERAAELARRHGEAREVLAFYGEVAGFQQLLAGRPEGPQGVLQARRKRENLSLNGSLRRLDGLLDVVRRVGPGPLAATARSLREGPAELKEGLLAQYLTGEPPEEGEGLRRWLLARTFLQPYAEREADGSPAAEAREDRCPRCRSAAQVGVLSDTGGQGALHLLCSLCSTVWRFPRLTCPLCGDHRTEKRTYYQTEAFPHVRLDVCERCGGYLKVVDLRRQSFAVPVADDLASLALDLWALDQGYHKAEPNLAGL